MAWWDDLLSFGTKAYEAAKPAAETAWNFAKENPTTTGAALGLLTGGGTGDYGSNNLRNTLGGAAAGYAAGQMFGGSSSAPSQVAAGMTPQTPGGGQDGITQWIAGNADKVGPASAAGAAGYSAPTAFGGGFFDDVSKGVKGASDFMKRNETAGKFGLEAVAALDKRDTMQKNQEMLRQRAAQESSQNARGQAAYDVYNANQKQVVDDNNAQARVTAARAPTDAFTNVMNATGRAVRAAGMDPMGTQTNTQKLARQRALSLSGTVGATTAAANATKPYQAQGYSTPAQFTPSTSAANTYGAEKLLNDQDMYKDYLSLATRAGGWDVDKAKNQINGKPV